MARLPVGVEDMQVFRAFDDMGDGFPGYHILRRYRIPILRDSFPYPLTVLIVQEGYRPAVVRHADELPAFPGIGPVLFLVSFLLAISALTSVIL